MSKLHDKLYSKSPAERTVGELASCNTPKMGAGGVLPPVTVTGHKDPNTAEFFNKTKEYDFPSYQALTEMGREHGFMKVDSSYSSDGRSHYNPLTQRATLYTKEEDFDPDRSLISAYLSEYAHKQQFDKSPVKSSVKWLTNDLVDYARAPFKKGKLKELWKEAVANSDNEKVLRENEAKMIALRKSTNPYVDSDALEYEAHSMIEPGLRKQFANIKDRVSEDEVPKMAGGGEVKNNVIPPTRQDSLNLMKNSNKVLGFYKNAKGYVDQTSDFGGPVVKPDEQLLFNNFNAGSKKRLMDSMEKIQMYPATVRNGKLSAQQDPSFKIDEYYKPVNDHQYLQRETATGTLNLDAPFQMFDKRIKPTFRHIFENPDIGDAATVFGYDPQLVKPADMKTAADWKALKKRYPTMHLNPPPVQPVTKKVDTSIINQSSNNALPVVPHGNPMQMNKYQMQGHTPVYGPGNSLLGMLADDSFYPDYNNDAKRADVNKVDSDLIQNGLAGYLKSKGVTQPVAQYKEGGEVKGKSTPITQSDWLNKYSNTPVSDNTYVPHMSVNQVTPIQKEELNYKVKNNALNLKKEIARRKQAVIDSDFVQSDGLVKSKQELSIAANALPERARLFPNKEMGEDLWNPAMWLAEGAASLGKAPQEAKEQNSITPYATAIGGNLLNGLMGFSPAHTGMETGKLAMQAARGPLKGLKGLLKKNVVNNTEIPFSEMYQTVTDPIYHVPELDFPVSTNTLQVKSTMNGSPLEKQISKEGTIHVNNINAHINNPQTAKADKFILKKVLDEKFPNSERVNYKDLQNAVHDELVPLHPELTSTYANYGAERIGYTGETQMQVDDAIINAQSEIERYTRGVQHWQPRVDNPENFIDSWQTPEGETKYAVKGYHLDFDHIDKAKEFIYEKQKVAQNFLDDHKNYLETLKNVTSRLPKDNQTIVFSNKDKFGTGSNDHFDESTLAHTRYLTSNEEPHAFHVLESQSDWAQKARDTKVSDIDKYKRRADIYQSNVEELKKTHDDMKKAHEDGTLYNGDKVQYHELVNIRNLIDEKKKMFKIAKADIANFDQKQFLKDAIPERLLQENMAYAAQSGHTHIRYPTPETASKIQGYSKEELTGDMNPEYQKVSDQLRAAVQTGNQEEVNRLMPIHDELLHNPYRTYSPQHKTILKKYADFPKMSKKVLGKEPSKVVDSKGNSWFEMEIPKAFKNKSAQIKALSLIPAAAVGAASSKNNWLDKYNN